MTASTVEITSLPDGINYPNNIDQPSFEVAWTGGTGPFNVEWIIDDDINLANANGHQQTATHNSVTSPDTFTPGSALADVSSGTTWYVQANVVDTDDSGELDDTNEFTYFDPIESLRFLYLLESVGYGFTPTDDPGGGWGTGIGGTQGPDGDTMDMDRFLYLLGNVGYGFTPTDDPPGGWGEAIGGTVGPDGDVIDPDRFLYLLELVTTTQPCPFLFSLSAQTVTQGSSLTVFGQGLVSASSPTADAYDAEVRLYESPSLAAAYQVLAISTYTAGDTQDSITVTIPSNASSGFVAVVHTTGATCAGSNFIGLTVIAVAADVQAGWWGEVWNLQNDTKIISALSDLAEADTEHIPGAIGKGHILLPQNHPDISDIIDRTSSPPVQNLVKIYQHNRFAYAFVPDDIEDAYDEDGAKLSRIFGRGQEVMLTWARCLWKDVTQGSPSITRTWLYGDPTNYLEWLDGEEASLIDNGGFEDAETAPWEKVGTAVLFADTVHPRTGSYSGRVSPGALNDGAKTEFSANVGQRAFVDVWVSDQGATFNKTFKLELIGPDGTTVLDSDTVSPTTGAWQPLTASALVTETGTHTLRITQTAGTVEDYWYIDDGAAYAKISGTYQLSGGTLLRLSRTNVLGGLHSLEAVFDDNVGGITIYFSVQPNQDYTFTLQFTGTNGDEIAAGMRMGGFVDRGTVTATGGVDSLTLTGTAGRTDQTARIFITTTEATGTTIYIDDSSLVGGAPESNGGEITLDVIEAMQARGTLDFIVPSYSRTHDSAGIPWPEDHQFEVDPEWTLYDLLDKFQGLGYRMGYWPIDWLGGGETGWELALFAPGNAGTDYSVVEEGPAILPTETIERARPSSAPPLETVVYGEGASGVWAVASLSTSELDALERREGFISNSRAVSSTTVFRAASHRLDLASTRGASFVADLTDQGDPLPYFDFLISDRMRSHLPSNTGRDYVTDDVYHVAAITSKLSGSGRRMSWQVDFGNYSLYARRLEILFLNRILDQQTSENLRPGTGSVSTQGSGGSGGGGSTPFTGPVPPHQHVQSDVIPTLDEASEIPTVWTDLEDISVSGAVEGDMAYKNDSGLWVVVSGTKADGKAPMIQADGSVAWETPAGGGGGGITDPGTYRERLQYLGVDWHWLMDDASGGIAESLSGWTLSEVGTPAYAQTGIDDETTNCIDFDGSTDGFALPTNFDSSVEARTVVLWIRPDDVSNKHMIVEWGGSTSGMAFGIDSGNLYAWGIESSGVRALCTKAISASTIYLVAATWSKRARTVRLYVDGALQDENGYDVTGGSAINWSGSDPAGIGYRATATRWPDNTNAAGFFDGKMSNMGWFHRVLAPWEIQYLYDGTT